MASSTLRSLPARILRTSRTSAISTAARSTSHTIRCAASLHPSLISSHPSPRCIAASIRSYSTATYEPDHISRADYEKYSNETMEFLLEKSEELIENNPDADVEYSSGVLTLVWPANGTYVINKQPPNKQIWLSSPLSGPKRYDYEPETGKWVYLRDGSTLDGLLKQELGIELEVENNE